MEDAANTPPAEEDDVLAGVEEENGTEEPTPEPEDEPLDLTQYPIEDRVARLEEGMDEIVNHLVDQGDMLKKLVDAQYNSPEPEPAPAAPPEGVPDPSKYFKPLPEGTARFRSVRFSEKIMIRDPGYHEVINGRAIFVNAKQVEFHNGIADVKDPELIEWMRQHPEKDTEFIEDPFAVPASHGPAIQEGGRGAGKTPQDPQPARRGSLEAAL